MYAGVYAFLVRVPLRCRFSFFRQGEEIEKNVLFPLYPSASGSVEKVAGPLPFFLFPPLPGARGSGPHQAVEPSERENETSRSLSLVEPQGPGPLGSRFPSFSFFSFLR